MIIGFATQSMDSTTIFVELSRKVSAETIKKLEGNLDKLVENYGARNNGDYSGFNIYAAVETVMNRSRLKWRFLKPDVYIYF